MTEFEIIRSKLYDKINDIIIEEQKKFNIEDGKIDFVQEYKLDKTLDELTDTIINILKFQAREEWIMYYLAVCDDDGKCYGFLKKDNSISYDPDNESDELMCFKIKKDASEKVFQVNLSHLLLPNGYDYRLAVVKV